MITTKALGVLGSLRKVYRMGIKNHIQSIRKSSHGHGHEHEHVVPYRTTDKGPDGGRSHEIAADVIGGFMWWWILWHLFTQPELVFGEYPDIIPSEWTDEELGIPPDEE